ncbi:MAG: hypothetical protein PPP58_06675 [Natronomonas sp.]
MLVRSEYAGELAVLSAWICALCPWSVTVAPNLFDDGVHLLRVHFTFGFAQLVFGGNPEGVTRFASAIAAPGLEIDPVITLGYSLAGIGAVVTGVAFASSIVYYVFDERLEAASPIDPARGMGGILIAAAVCFTAATAVLFDALIGTIVPVGVLFMYVLGAVLLTVDRSAVELGKERSDERA